MRDEFPKIVEKSRTKHPLYPDSVEGQKQGYFQIKKSGNLYRVLMSDGGGWDHVSISMDKKRCPTWEEMCWLKDLFFTAEETVVQYHPPSSEHISMHNYCLHLWRFQGEFPRPDSIMVGF